MWSLGGRGGAGCGAVGAVQIVELVGVVLDMELVGVLLVVKNHKNGYELWNRTVQSLGECNKIQLLLVWFCCDGYKLKNKSKRTKKKSLTFGVMNTLVYVSQNSSSSLPCKLTIFVL